MEIKNSFTSYDGKVYQNLRSINFLDAEDLRNCIGSFVNETKVEPNSFFGGSRTETEGVYIYKCLYDIKKAFRIYKDWSNNVFCNIEQHPSEAGMLSKLIDKQKQIKLTEFPTGIITLRNYVIGQEIALYENSKTLEEKIYQLTKEEIIKCYIEILKILKELLNNEIVYSDIHTRNFMLCNNTIKLIDFDPYLLSFNNTQESKMIVNLKYMFNKINEYRNIDFSLKNEETLNNIEETVMIKTLK